MGGEEDKRFLKLELVNKIFGDILVFEKRKINYLFINIIMVFRRML